MLQIFIQNLEKLQSIQKIILVKIVVQSIYSIKYTVVQSSAKYNIKFSIKK